jgi:hypothetical protein
MYENGINLSEAVVKSQDIARGRSAPSDLRKIPFSGPPGLGNGPPQSTARADAPGPGDSKLAPPWQNHAWA